MRKYAAIEDVLVDIRWYLKELVTELRLMKRKRTRR